ncbi:MAG: protein transport protein bos1 [Stictis urceolatum]|nr:protein transport protein bos1 [Stictis urceolata]
MNVLFNSALKQSSQLRSDLDTFASSASTAPASLQGQISTTLTSFSRTINNYSETSKKELNPTKAEKARDRLKAFKGELQDYRQQFDALKRDREESIAAQSRSELLGRRPHHGTNTPENPYASQNLPQSSSFAPSSNLSFGTQQQTATRESHALREQSFFEQGNAQLDEYLERGRAVLGDLGAQREMLKGTQRKLYDVASTLGVSGDTIRMVERRAKQDKWIFWAGVAVFFAFCWLILRYLR